jgi:hypothetical protein
VSLRSRRKSIRKASEALEILQKVRNMVTDGLHLYVRYACYYSFCSPLVAAKHNGISVLKTHRIDTDDVYITKLPCLDEVTFQLAIYTNKNMSEFMYQRVPIIPVTDTDTVPTKQLDRQTTYGCIQNTI